MHTKLPWAEHPAYRDAKPYAFKIDGKELMALDITIASGDKLIGELRMSTGKGGYAHVDNEQEARDNAALLFKAVNSYDALVAALQEAVAVIERIKPEKNGNGTIVRGRAALAKAGAA